MNLKVIQKEVKSEALKEIIESLGETVGNVKGGKIDPKLATIEISGVKHIIRCMALDWAYNKRVKR